MSWVLTGKLIHSYHKPSIGKQVGAVIYGEAVKEIIEDEQGRLWAYCEEEPYATQINFNPFTGEKAKTMREDYNG